MRGYYFITGSRLSRRSNTSDVKNALKAGVRVVQYRDKFAGTKEMFEEALELRKICKNITFLINDRVDIALAIGADGVHLGQDDLPYAIARKMLGKKKIIGVTVHNFTQAREAQKLGADYIAVAPIFTTKTKKYPGLPVGINLLNQVKRHIPLPIVAIGGINLANANAVIQAGADCLCAISAVVTRSDVKKEIEKFERLFENK